MEKVIKYAVVLAAFLVVGCNNKTKDRQAVVAKYSSDVWEVEGKNYHFIARKPDGSVWYVETNGMPVEDENGESRIKAEALIFGPTENEN